MSNFRIPGAGRVNHNKPVQFTFNGKTVSGFEGDTVASFDRAAAQLNNHSPLLHSVYDAEQHAALRRAECRH